MIDFDLNFIVDREKLDEYFNNQTKYFSLLETSFGYTGVNIKFPLSKDINELILKKLIYDETGSVVTRSSVSYKDHFESKQDQKKKAGKQRYNTFLVFHSGKVIMSGIERSFMEDTFYEFMKIIDSCYDIIKEKLEV